MPGTMPGTMPGMPDLSRLVMTCHRRCGVDASCSANVVDCKTLLRLAFAPQLDLDIEQYLVGKRGTPSCQQCIAVYLIPTVRTDARRSNVCSRQHLRCIKRPQGKRSTTLLQLAFASQMGPDIEQYIVGNLGKRSLAYSMSLYI